MKVSDTGRHEQIRGDYCHICGMPFLIFLSLWQRLNYGTLLAFLAPSFTHCEKNSSDFFLGNLDENKAGMPN